MHRVKIISVDFQKDFSAPGGTCYQVRPCIDFIKHEFVPYCRQEGLKIAEIVSDYRTPRPGDDCLCCVPGTSGYESEISADIKYDAQWVKCMNSPVWVREHGGQADYTPGLPYPNPTAFTAWLQQTIGRPDDVQAVVLIGLTLDCCVLCTAQELSFRAYPVKFLVEGVDPYSGDQAEKASLFRSPVPNWGQPWTWEQFKTTIARDL